MSLFIALQRYLYMMKASDETHFARTVVRLDNNVINHDGASKPPPSGVVDSLLVE